MTTPRFSSPLPTWFAAPRLPLLPAAMALLMIATHAVLALLHQPAAYWFDPRQAAPADPLRFLFGGGPLLFGALALAYLVLVGLLLTRLNQSAGLALAGLFFFLHLCGAFRLLHLGLPPLLVQRSIADSTLLTNVLSYILGLLFAAAILPHILPGAGLAGRLGRALAFTAWGLGGAWLALLLFSLAWVVPRASDAWQPLLVDASPPPRYNAAVAYDSQRRVAVLFGGRSMGVDGQTVYLNDTWEWDGTRWTEIRSSDRPSARSGHVMVYDDAHDLVLLFSGINNNGVLGDLWAWNGRDWDKQCPVCNPAGRAGSGMVFDEGLQKPVIYGGYGQKDGENVWYDNAWSWDGAAWSFEEILSSAPATSGFAMVYDAANRRMVAFMSGSELGGTWIWQARTWRKLDTPNQPLPAGEISLVYDPNAQHVVLFGGLLDSTTALQQTWVLKNDTWREIRADRGPSPRWGQVAFYDPTRQRVVLFGGVNYPRDFNDLWELKLPEEAP